MIVIIQPDAGVPTCSGMEALSTERLGHSSIAITLDTYSHVSPGLQEAAAKRFDEAFTTKYNESAAESVH